MSSVGGPRIVKDGLVLYLDAGNKNSYSSGSTWYDLLNTYDGILTNGAQFDSDMSISFDGSNDYVNLGDLDISSSFTLSIWFKGNTTQTSQFCGLFNKSNSNNFGNWGLYGDSSSTYVRFGFVNTSNSQREISNSSYSDIKSNTWVNYVGTYDFSNLRLYRNGIQIASKSESTTPISNNEIASIGYRVAANNYAYSGLVSNASIYNRALSPQEVIQNYNAMKNRFGL